MRKQKLVHPVEVEHFFQVGSADDVEIVFEDVCEIMSRREDITFQWHINFQWPPERRLPLKKLSNERLLQRDRRRATFSEHTQ